MSGNEPIKVDMSPFRRALKGRSASVVQRIEWVAQNRLRNPNEIDPSEPPDMAAFDWLLKAKKDEDWFFQKMVPALIPTKKELEVQAQQKDDGRALSILSSFQEQFDAEAASAQGTQGEHPVPAEAHQVREREPVGP